MTEALKPVISRLNYNDVQFDYFTAPESPVTLPDGRVIEGIPSINSGDDSARSALHCRPFVEPLIPKYDAFLVACYSAHPLVGMLKATIAMMDNAARKNGGRDPVAIHRRRYVTGIFEASLTASLMLISSFQLVDDWNLHKKQEQTMFGIVTTGDIWKDELTNAVAAMIGGSDSSHVQCRGGKNADNCTSTTGPVRFAGVETTGLMAVELHEMPPNEVQRGISDATERLLSSAPSRAVRVICLGCAGMAGMGAAVRAGCIKTYGKADGEMVHIVDGVVAGVGYLVNACKANF
jgi:Asp/Glu/hydantoin racemase